MGMFPINNTHCSFRGSSILSKKITDNAERPSIPGGGGGMSFGSENRNLANEAIFETPLGFEEPDPELGTLFSDLLINRLTIFYF